MNIEDEFEILFFTTQLALHQKKRKKFVIRTKCLGLGYLIFCIPHLKIQNAWSIHVMHNNSRMVAYNQIGGLGFLIF